MPDFQTRCLLTAGFSGAVLPFTSCWLASSPPTGRCCREPPGTTLSPSELSGSSNLDWRYSSEIVFLSATAHPQTQISKRFSVDFESIACRDSKSTRKLTRKRLKNDSKFDSKSRGVGGGGG